MTVDPFDDPGAAELRRYLRQASMLIGELDLPLSQRVAVLRRARHHLRVVLRAIERRLSAADAVPDSDGIPDTVDDPLTKTLKTLTIGTDS